MSRFRADQWLAEWEGLGGEAWSTTPSSSSVPPRPAWLGLSHPGAADRRAAALAEELDGDPSKRLAVLFALTARESRRAVVRLGVG
ncbi:MAG TPA: hypothetical protein VFE03_05890 [Caulobacteraceae bacterium]|nr:hypothetical protein [Caulobacteraceae bacterium]